MVDYIYVKGKVKWFRPNALDTNYDPPTWSYIHYPVAEDLDVLRDLQSQGMKNVIKKDEDGWFVRFKRPAYIIRYVNRNPVQVPLGAPKILTKDGGDFDPNTSVGNGSDVTTKLEVRSHSVPNSPNKAKAVRWDSSKINHLVEFDRNADLKADEEKLRDLIDQPPPVDLF